MWPDTSAVIVVHCDETGKETLVFVGSIVNPCQMSRTQVTQLTSAVRLGRMCDPSTHYRKKLQAMKKKLTWANKWKSWNFNQHGDGGVILRDDSCFQHLTLLFSKMLDLGSPLFSFWLSCTDVEWWLGECSPPSAAWPPYSVITHSVIPQNMMGCWPEQGV